MSERNIIPVQSDFPILSPLNDDMIVHHPMSYPINHPMNYPMIHPMNYHYRIHPMNYHYRMHPMNYHYRYPMIENYSHSMNDRMNPTKEHYYMTHPMIPSREYYAQPTHTKIETNIPGTPIS